MSSDHQVLLALAMKTRQEMRYFELVSIVCLDDRRKCFICLGKHAAIFMRQDLNGKIHDGGELRYAYIRNVIQDANTREFIMFDLSDNVDPCWKSDRLFIKSENRDLLLKHLRCNWQTDHMWRVGRVEMFPFSVHPITKDQLQEPYVEPFMGHRWASYQGYRFMLPNEFVDQSNWIQAEHTGEYINPDGVTLVFHVHELLTLDQMVQLNRDHIRWVATEYKAQLVKNEGQFYVLKNSLRQKRMNLAGDVAAWYGWEIIIRTKEVTLVCLLLRRQYVPPVCNCAQDLAIVMRCPADRNGVVSNFTQLLLQAHLVADTLCTDASSVSVYRDMVQAKLDALRFDEDGFEWVRAHLKLNTRWQKLAKTFVRSIVELFIEDNIAGFEPEILEQLFTVDPDEEEAEDLPEVDAKDIEAFLEKLPALGLSLLDLTPDGYENTKPKVQHMWVCRFARYLAWAVDGGMLHSKFTLDIMIDNITALSELRYKKAVAALNFMLHLRPQDPSRPYLEVKITEKLKQPDFCQWSFNDRVMQALLNQDYLRKQLGRENEDDYFGCLANLLASSAGTNLKAYVCRMFMEVRMDGPLQHADHGKEQKDPALVGVPALVSLAKTAGIFIATYASAALVNLSNGNDGVKVQLMGLGIAEIVIQNIRTKDDDLICYTLMLLVNISKDPYNRSILGKYAAIPILHDLLTSSYHQCKQQEPDEKQSAVSSVSVWSPIKERILTQVAILIGHFAIDETFRELLTHESSFTIRCLIYMFENAAAASPLVVKTMFALKQLCYGSGTQKYIVGGNVITILVERLGDKKLEKSSEFVFHALLLLQMLISDPHNCSLMDKAGLKDVFNDLNELPICKKIDHFKERRDQLLNEIERVTTREQMV